LLIHNFAIILSIASIGSSKSPMLTRFIFRTKSELQREKQKDYRNVVIIQVLIIFLGLTLSETLEDGYETPVAKAVMTLFSCFGAVYCFLLWDLLRDFTSNKILINAILAILIIMVIGGSLVEFPYYKIIVVSNRHLFLLVVHSLLFLIEVTVISFAIRDIFQNDFLTPDKLWGAACVFLLTGTSFGSLIDLICIIRPGSLGEYIEIGWSNYSASINYSLSILGGTDPGRQNPSILIRNIGVFEAVWSNLYAMLIIGKLMGLPRPEKN
jgi:hypothetical protein